ncbi:MAG: hypothetical protein J7575_07315, partial [Chloroflexi bacterium]|nr:hypothetical protein [Chloroflexota bacterium]
TETARALAIGVGGTAAMAVAVVAGVWSGAYATLGEDARRRASFTWWVVNRLLFLAAATSFQGFLPFFLMCAFGVSAEEAAAMNGNLMSVIGLLILLSALVGGPVADRLGKRRVVLFSGLVAAVGGAAALGAIWMPSMAILYHDDLDPYCFDFDDLFAAAREPKEVWRLPEVGHTQASEVYPEEFYRRVVGFFDRYLCADLASLSRS